MIQCAVLTRLVKDFPVSHRKNIGRLVEARNRIDWRQAKRGSWRIIIPGEHFIVKIFTPMKDSPSLTLTPLKIEGEEATRMQ